MRWNNGELELAVEDVVKPEPFVFTVADYKAATFNFKPDPISDPLVDLIASVLIEPGWKLRSRVNAVLGLAKLGVRYGVWRVGKWVHAATGRRIE